MQLVANPIDQQKFDAATLIHPLSHVKLKSFSCLSALIDNFSLMAGSGERIWHCCSRCGGSCGILLEMASSSAFVRGARAGARAFLDKDTSSSANTAFVRMGRAVNQKTALL